MIPLPEKCVIDPQRDCFGLQKANILERQLAEYREQARSTHEKIYDRIRELEKAEAARNEQYKQIMEKLDQLLEWQEAQQKKPQAFVDDLKGKAIWAVLAAVITFILARVGL